MRLALIAASLLLVVARMLGEDVGDHYIASKQQIAMIIDRTEKMNLTVRETIEFSPNLYFETRPLADESHTFAVRTSIIDLSGVSNGSKNLIGEPKITLSTGKYQGITRSLDGFRFLVDVDLGEKPPPKFQMIVEYSLSLGSNLGRLGIRVEPYVHNFEFIPPIFFKLGMYQVCVEAPHGAAIETARKGLSSEGTGSMELRLEDLASVTFWVNEPRVGEKSEPHKPTKAR